MRGTVIATSPCYQVLEDGGKPIYCELGEEKEWDREDTPLPRSLEFKNRRDQRDHDDQFGSGEKEVKAGVSDQVQQSRDSSLLDVVTTLDPYNDDLWTTTGQPQLSAIKAVMREAGIPDPEWVKRKEVDRVVGEDYTQTVAIAQAQKDKGSGDE